MIGWLILSILCGVYGGLSGPQINNAYLKSSVNGRVLPAPLAEAKAMRAINHWLLKLRATPLLLAVCGVCRNAIVGVVASTTTFNNTSEGRDGDIQTWTVPATGDIKLKLGELRVELDIRVHKIQIRAMAMGQAIW